jgi:hypothetical protein
MLFACTTTQTTPAYTTNIISILSLYYCSTETSTEQLLSLFAYAATAAHRLLASRSLHLFVQKLKQEAVLKGNEAASESRFTKPYTFVSIKML